MTVKIYKEGLSTPLASDITDANGAYSFSGLDSFTYIRIRETNLAAMDRSEITDPGVQDFVKMEFQE